MSALSCCNVCGTIEVTNIPGSEGAAGTNGVDGLNAFAHVTALFLLPGNGSDVPVSVDSSVWAVLGQIVLVGVGADGLGTNGPQHFTVAALPSATQMTLTQTNVAGDVSTPGTQIDIGAVVTPSAL